MNIFLSKINLFDATVCSVEQSKVDVEYGESDMTVVVVKNGNKYGLLIEDKIDAVTKRRGSFEVPFAGSNATCKHGCSS